MKREAQSRSLRELGIGLLLWKQHLKAACSAAREMLKASKRHERCLQAGAQLLVYPPRSPRRDHVDRRVP